MLCQVKEQFKGKFTSNKNDMNENVKNLVKRGKGHHGTKSDTLLAFTKLAHGQLRPEASEEVGHANNNEFLILVSHGTYCIHTTL